MSDLLGRIDLAAVLVQFAVLLFSLTIHEAAHAWTASRLGDPTARELGRVSLNPAVHMDPIGTLLFPLLQLVTHLPLIGWAKPVPVNPARLVNPRRDQMFISLAGPGANLLAAAGFFLVLAAIKLTSSQVGASIDQMILTMRIPLQASILPYLISLAVFGLIINLALALFNLLPIPPLDGHWMLLGILPYNIAGLVERLGSYGFIVLYALMFAGVLRIVFVPVQWIMLLLLAL